MNIIIYKLVTYIGYGTFLCFLFCLAHVPQLLLLLLYKSANLSVSPIDCNAMLGFAVTVHTSATLKLKPV
jgi:hypothetical protein